MPKLKRRAIRACSVCEKMGHNKATCPQKIESKVEKYEKKIEGKPSTNPTLNQNRGLNFFVHHVDFQKHDSPHIVNLKKDEPDILDKIQAIAPNTKNNSSYQFYHQQKDTQKQKIKGSDLPVKNINEIPIEFDLQNYITSKTKKTKSRPVKNIKLNFKNKADKKREFKLPKIQFSLPQINFPWKKLAYATATIAIIAIVPLQARSFYKDFKLTTEAVSAKGTAGFMALQNSTVSVLNSNLKDAQTSITFALGEFESAVEILNNKHAWLQKVVSVVPILNNEVQSRQKLLLSGQQLALGNTYLIKGIEEASKEKEDFNFTDRIKKLNEHIKAALPNYQKALENLNGVDAGNLPLEYQASFKDFKVLFALVLDDLENLHDLGKTVDEIFGGEGLRRYLLVFQNESEMRATGGFAGSIATMDIKDGKLENLKVQPGGSYDLQGQLTEYVEPPAPLLLVGKRWEFQDANWFPDFPASAKKMMWFYRKSRNKTVDGVIAINSSVLERILAITGPIEDEKRNLTLASADAISQIQETVEFGEEKKDDKPKQILSDLAPLFIEQLQNLAPEKLITAFYNLKDALEKKEIQAYFTDPEAENTVKSFGWSGSILDTNSNQDYLMLINTNIQGQKTDAEIIQHIDMETVIEKDGTAINTVVITRTHNGKKGEKLYGDINIDYLRLYVPEGSELLSAGGFTWPDDKYFRTPPSYVEKDEFLLSIEKEIGIDKQTGTRITNEFGKTAFGNWAIVSPGETIQIHFKYKLPFKINLKNTEDKNWKDFLLSNTSQTAKHQLIVQKQSGQDSTFETKIIFPPNWQPAWSDGQNINLAVNGMSIDKMNLDKDAIWSIAVKNINN